MKGKVSNLKSKTANEQWLSCWISGNVLYTIRLRFAPRVGYA